MSSLIHLIDAEFLAAVGAALSIPLVIAGSVVLMVRKSLKSEPGFGRDIPPARRPHRSTGLRSRRLPALARR